MTNRSSSLFAAGILLAAGLGLSFRLPGLALRPMHCDEANQALLAGRLFDGGLYRYDPFEYHGPTMPWLTQAALRLSGTQDYAHSESTTYRLVPLVFSLGLILLLLALGDGLGRPAAVLAAFFLAVSPAVVFYGRYFIHETLLVFFTLAAIASGWRYVRTRSLGWAAATGASVGLMAATKETWVLAAAAMGVGLALTVAWAGWRDGAIGDVRAYLRPAAIAVAALAALLVALAFFSSFGTNGRGPIDAMASYAVYWRRGSQSGIHTHPWYYYLELLFACRPARGFFWSEGLIGLLAAVGFASALREKGDSPHLPERPEGCCAPMGTVPFFPRFLAFYTLVLTALYCAVPYKTPWCMLSFLDGMVLLAGIGAWSLLRAARNLPARVVVCLALSAAVAHLGWQSYVLNFRLYADQRNPWVYAHTPTDMPKLGATLDEIARVAAEGHEMLIHVVTPENYWPLPWYLRQFNPDRVGYWQDPAAWAKATERGDSSPPPPAVIILTPDVQPLVDARLPAAYQRQMIFGLRPGVLLFVYVRDDLWQSFLAARTAAR